MIRINAKVIVCFLALVLGAVKVYAEEGYWRGEKYIFLYGGTCTSAEFEENKQTFGDIPSMHLTKVPKHLHDLIKKLLAEYSLSIGDCFGLAIGQESKPNDDGREFDRGTMIMLRITDVKPVKYEYYAFQSLVF
jgi:hypothetical protein